ncbi:MAG: ABC transporter permease [Candidatus Promineifilaceae bacterium]|jgi:galactofuranose transport system permease protein
MDQSTSIWHKLRDSQLFWPLLALGLIMLFNLFFTPGFYDIEVKDGHLSGFLIDILNRGSMLMLMAIGMTMVIATGGVDLSVGAVVAISAATATVLINPALANQLISSEELIQDVTRTPLWLCIVAALAVSTLCGLWNGLLVSRARIQPMVATLVLMVAGRGIAQLITNGQIITVYYSPYFFIGNGYLLGIPFSLFITAIVLVLVWLLARGTAFGLFVESVGINARSSFFSGINEQNVKLIVYTICGFCAGVAGLIYSSNVKSADANNAGWGAELDAILAVVIGGTLMTGGRFSLLASVIGALVIQSISTTMYAVGVPAMAAMAIKGLIVLVVVLLYSEQTKSVLTNFVERVGAQS